MPPRKSGYNLKSLPAKEMTAVQPTRRQPTRGRPGAKTSSKKSPYFEHPPPGLELEEGEEDARPNKRQRGSSTPAPSSSTKRSKKPGEIFIPINQPSPGDIGYQCHKIHPNTLDFLKDSLTSGISSSSTANWGPETVALAKNNDRTWFGENGGLFKAAKSDFESFVEDMSKSIITNVDDTIPELPLKDLVADGQKGSLRMLFSVAAAGELLRSQMSTILDLADPHMDKDHRRLELGARGGLWHTDAQHLNLLRRNIDKNPRQIKSILAGRELAKEFFGAQASKSEQKAIQAFVERNKEDALKTAPKNYPKDHEEIELLRLRSYTLGKRLTDEEIIGDGVVQRITDIFKSMEPFISYLNSVVMPDINAVSSNGEDAAASGDSDGN